MMPEYVSHPPLGLPRADMEPAIDPQPSEGPAGTVLLQVFRKGTKTALPSDLPAMPDEYRY